MAATVCCVREGHHRARAVRVCVRALPSVYIERTISMSFGHSRINSLLRDVRVRAEPRYVVVARSSVSCRRFQRGARGVDVRGACCVGCRDGVECLMVIWVVGVGPTSYEVSACPQTTRFLLASIGGAYGRREVREDHGRAPRRERLKQA